MNSCSSLHAGTGKWLISKKFCCLFWLLILGHANIKYFKNNKVLKVDFWLLVLKHALCMASDGLNPEEGKEGEKGVYVVWVTPLTKPPPLETWRPRIDTLQMASQILKKEASSHV